MASPAPAAVAERQSFNLNVAIEKFAGGAKENPETFLCTIESAKALYNWEDKQALAYAGLSLKGKALDWFNNQPEFINWSSFRKALIDRFGLDPKKMLSKLTKRVQGKKESVRDCADVLRTLVRYSRDPHLKATLQHFFTEGLRAEVATFVKSQRPQTFEDAVDLGEYYEDNFPAGTTVFGAPRCQGRHCRRSRDLCARWPRLPPRPPGQQCGSGRCSDQAAGEADHQAG